MRLTRPGIIQLSYYCITLASSHLFKNTTSHAIRDSSLKTAPARFLSSKEADHHAPPTETTLVSFCNMESLLPADSRVTGAMPESSNHATSANNEQLNVQTRPGYSLRLNPSFTSTCLCVIYTGNPPADHCVPSNPCRLHSNKPNMNRPKLPLTNGDIKSRVYDKLHTLKSTC